MCIINLFNQKRNYQLMKSPKNSLSTICGFMRKAPANQKIVKASDVKLKDMLINGVKLRCFKAIKKKKILLSGKRQIQSQYLLDQSYSSRNQVQQTQDETLFKNNAIKKRLKSLESNDKQTNQTSINSFRMKKTSFSSKQANKVPIDILKPIKNQRYQRFHSTRENQTLSDNFEIVDINNKYYSLLKKELTMYSTNNRFNSVIAKNKKHFSKYVGFNAAKLKKKFVDLDSHLKQKILDKNKILEQVQKYQSLNPKDSRRLASDEWKKSLKYIYKVLIDEQKEQNTEQMNQKMKICFSTKNNFKTQKDQKNEKTKYTEETHRSRHSQSHPEQNLVSGQTLQ